MVTHDSWKNNVRTETEYVSQMLTLIRRFAQHHACHVWFVAHPRQVSITKLRIFFLQFSSHMLLSLKFQLIDKQLHNWAGEPPNLYDISGSAHFINKCDNGIVIHRNRNPEAGPVDKVQVRRSFYIYYSFYHVWNLSTDGQTKCDDTLMFSGLCTEGPEQGCWNHR